MPTAVSHVEFAETVTHTCENCNAEYSLFVYQTTYERLKSWKGISPPTRSDEEVETSVTYKGLHTCPTKKPNGKVI